MRVLLVAGAGTSIELGVPGMLGMALEFLDHARQWEVDPDLVEKIMGAPPDVEHLIEELDRISSARSSLELIGQSDGSWERIDKLRAEVEWFVQHAAERVVARDAELMWGSLLRVSRSVDLTFVTTNYDRAIELAANAEKIRLDDGFGSFGEKETAPWVGFGKDGQRRRLVKLHGSTDWYAASDGSPLKLRHPMPLFGRSALRLADGQELGSALVLPSREKLLTRSPYPRLSQDFLNAGDDCDLAVFIGSSLRDNHIRDAAKSTAGRAPVFIVNPEGNGYGIEGAVAISQCASTFLVSSLPSALMTADPARALAAVKPDASSGGMLSALRQALDPNASTPSRCFALDELNDRGATLEPELLRQFLADGDSTVARYALGLISLSPAHEELIKAAESSPHARDSAFDEDLRLLRVVVSNDAKQGAASS